jgi:hypothetical protein
VHRTTILPGSFDRRRTALSPQRFLADLVHRSTQDAQFGAHAWVEAEGRSVGEPYPDGYHVTLLSVPPAAKR